MYPLVSTCIWILVSGYTCIWCKRGLREVSEWSGVNDERAHVAVNVVRANKRKLRCMNEAPTSAVNVVLRQR